MRSLIAFAALLCAVPAQATDHDGQLWTTATAEFELADGVDFSGQFVARFSDAADGVSELQYQADVSWEARPGLTLDVGYSYVPRYSGGDLTTREHRVRQQASLRLGEVLGGRVEGRVRLEQRWRDDGDDTMLRLRTRLAWTRPIGPNDLAVRVWHETFMHLNDTDWGGEARWARARNQLSLRRKFGSSITGEVGYLNQYDVARGREDQIAHALTLSLTQAF